jgi:hypothetical protein
MSIRDSRKWRWSILSGAALLIGLWVPINAAATDVGFLKIRSFAPPEGFVQLRGLAINNTNGPNAQAVYASDHRGGVVDRFSPTGGWENVSVNGLALPFQLAVNQVAGPLEGDVYVAGEGAGVVYRFSPDLVLQEEITGLVSPLGVAVNSVGDLLVSEESGSIKEFNSQGEPVDASGNPNPKNTIVEGLRNPQVLAMDNSDDLFVGTLAGTFKYVLLNGTYKRVDPALAPYFASGLSVTSTGNLLLDTESEIRDYGVSGNLIGTSSPGTIVEGYGISTDFTTNDVYVADAGAGIVPGVVDIFEEGSTPEPPITEGAQASGPANFTLNGTLNSNTTSYHFSYNAGESCEGGSVTPDQAGTGGPVHSEITGLEALRKYSYCLVATNKFGSTIGDTMSIETGPQPPVITSEQFAEIGAHSASLSAQIAPENQAGNYHVEYELEPLSGAETVQSTSEVHYPTSGPVAASIKLSGLQPNREYHFRFTATNASNETEHGAEQVFRTLPVPTSLLPDARVYEMVSPPNNNGAEIYYPHTFINLPLSEGTFTELPFEVAHNGNAVAYVSDPTSGGTGKGGGGLGNEYVARRGPAGGWTQSNVQPAGRLLTYYRGFSPEDLATGVLTAAEGAPLSPEAPGEEYGALYACADVAGPCVAFGEEGPGAPYRPLFGKPLYRGVSQFGTSEAGHQVHISLIGGGGVKAGAVFAAGSNNFNHLLFEANDALPGVSGPLGSELDEDVFAEVQGHQEHDYLYDNEGGRLSVIDVLPNGSVAGNATFGAPSEGPSAQPNFTRVISSDGSRIFWTDLNTGVVYARVDGVSTVQVSEGDARYWTASTDGRYVFYSEAGRLYRFDLEAPVDAQRTALVEPNAGVLAVIGASEDGQNVYFVAKDVLALANGEGVSPSTTQPNLYLSHAGGAPIFIATLSSEDGGGVKPYVDALDLEQPGIGDWVSGAGNRTAEVSADGTGLVFISNQRLASVGFPAGYPNEGLEEIYLYSADSNRLFCVSCSSTGEAAKGGLDGAAAFPPISWVPTYTPQWVSDDGNRVFFDGAVPLVAQATNHLVGVYEWEREATGDCKSAAAVNGGCIYLLSDGSSESASWLLGSSANGNDAFFVTRSRLVPEDQNEAFDLYDARVEGVQLLPPSACVGTGCQGVPAPPPPFATPASVTFHGGGNLFAPKPQSVGPSSPQGSSLQVRKFHRALAACHKKRRRSQRTNCEARARRRYGRATRRAGR